LFNLKKLECFLWSVLIAMLPAMLRFCGEYRLQSSLVNGYPSAGTFRYEQYEKAFDAHWDEIKALPDCVSIEVAGDVSTHEIYREIRANDKFRHYFDQAKIKLTTRYGEEVVEKLTTHPFAILNDKDENVTCKVTQTSPVKADEAFVAEFVKRVMDRVRALCTLYKPGHRHGEKEC
jgi:hypothetical protein